MNQEEQDGIMCSQVEPGSNVSSSSDCSGCINPRTVETNQSPKNERKSKSRKPTQVELPGSTNEDVGDFIKPYLMKKPKHVSLQLVTIIWRILYDRLVFQRETQNNRNEKF